MQDNEGHPFFRVDQMMSVVNASLPHGKPNVVLIHCGTNDAYQSYEVDGTGGRMGVAAGLGLGVERGAGGGGGAVDAAVESINGQYRSLATSLQAAGRKLVVAEMMNDGWIQESDLVDGGASGRGWLDAHGRTVFAGGADCEQPGVAYGAGDDEPVGRGDAGRRQVRLGDLNGDGRTDWLWLDDEGRITTMLNERADSEGLRPAWWDMEVTHGGMDEAAARAKGASGAGVWVGSAGLCVFCVFCEATPAWPALLPGTCGCGRTRAAEGGGRRGTGAAGRLDGRRTLRRVGDGQPRRRPESSGIHPERPRRLSLQSLPTATAAPTSSGSTAAPAPPSSGAFFFMDYSFCSPVFCSQSSRTKLGKRL